MFLNDVVFIQLLVEALNNELCFTWIVHTVYRQYHITYLDTVCLNLFIVYFIHGKYHNYLFFLSSISVLTKSFFWSWNYPVCRRGQQSMLQESDRPVIRRSIHTIWDAVESQDVTIFSGNGMGFARVSFVFNQLILKAS